MHLLPSAALHRLAAWIALVAILLNASWPVIANAQPAEAGIPFEICTPQGIKQLTANASGQDDAPRQPAAKHPGPHCPFCLGLGDGPAILTDGTARLDIPHPAGTGITATSAVSHQTATPHPAQPRAPPALPDFRTLTSAR